jgi:hypothetical protein
MGFNLALKGLIFSTFGVNPDRMMDNILYDVDKSDTPCLSLLSYLLTYSMEKSPS